jgi:MerR family transcriptional regulator, repressor of the yfmOP operon
MKTTDLQSADWLRQEKEYEKDQWSVLLQQMAYENQNDKVPDKDETSEIKEDVKKLNELLTELILSAKKNFMTEWMTSEEVKQALGISERTMHTWRNSGKLPFSYIEQKFYYKKQDIENLLLKGYHKKNEVKKT